MYKDGGIKMSRMMSKPMLLLLSVLFFVIVLVGCSSDAEKNDSSGQAEEQVVTWLSARPEDGAIVQTIKELGDQFAEDHPGFKLDIQVTADRPSYLTKLRTLVASGDIPEFIDTDADPFAQELVDQGLLVDMEKYLKEEGVYNQFYKPALKYQELPNGSLYLLPLEYHLEMTWYNKKILEDNNIEVPQTIDDMVSASERLSSKGITPIAVAGADVWPVLRYAAMTPFRETGNQFIRQLSKGEAKMSNETGMRAAEFTSEIGEHFQEGFATTDYTTAKNLFLNGDAAMYRMGTWELPSFTEENLPEELKGQIDYFYLPMTENATTSENEFFGNSGIGFGANAEKFDGIAKEFLSYVIENYSDLYVKKQQMSPIKFNIKDESNYSDLFLRVVEDMNNYGSEFAKPWDTLLDPDTNSVMSDMVIQLADGQITPEDFARTIDETIEQNTQE